MISRFALIAWLCVASCASLGEAFRQKGDSIDASSVGAADEKALLEHLKKAHQPALKFVVSKFAKHDVVLLGETHQVAENCQFVASLLAPLHKQGVRTLIWEFTRSRLNKEVQRLITARDFDEQVAISIFRQHPWATWGYREYLDVLRAAWKLNRSLPDTAPRFRVIGMESDNWTQHDFFFGKQTRTQTFQHLLAREKHMTGMVRSHSLNKKEKALVHVGLAHANLKQGIRLGKVLHEEFGQRVGQVILHHKWPAGRDAAPVTKLLERLASQASGGQAIGFQIADTPIDRVVDPSVVYWRAVPNARLSDFAHSYVFLKPLDKLHRMTWISRFVNDKNFAAARDIAGQMKWIKKDAVQTPKQLNDQLRRRFAGQIAR